MSVEFKDSGVEWIGQIPDSWDRSVLRNYLRQPITDGPHETPNCIDDGVPFVSIDSLNDSKFVDFSVVKRFISEADYQQYVKKTVLEKGDILFTKSATIGKTAIVNDEKYMIWSPIAIIKPKYELMNNLYLYYVLSSYLYIEYVTRLGGFNTQANVGMRTLEKSVIPCPPLRIQNDIAKYLDTQCKLIDSQIESVKQAIMKLEDYKQSIVHEAVAKGLDSTDSMKKSGLNWIDSIPSSWTVSRVKDILKPGKDGIRVGPFGSSLKELSVLSDGEYKIYGQANLISKDFKINSDYINQTDYESFIDYSIVPGDVLLSMMGSIGKCAVVPSDIKPGIMDSHLIRVRLSDKIMPDYFSWMYSGYYTQNMLLYLSKGSIMNGLNSSTIKELPIVYPSLEEQACIVSYLEDRCSSIDYEISIRNEILDNLLSLKQSVIYEYITGKKQVPQEV